MRTSRLFSIKKNLPVQSALRLCWDMGLIWVRKTFAFFLLQNLMSCLFGIFLHFAEVFMYGNLAPNPQSSPLDLASPTKLQLVHSIPLSKWFMKTGRMISETQEIVVKCNLYFPLNFICKMVNTKFQNYGKKNPNLNFSLLRRFSG